MVQGVQAAGPFCARLSPVHQAGPVLPGRGVDQLEDAGGVVHRFSPDDHHEHDQRYAATDRAMELPHTMSPAQARRTDEPVSGRG